jgi:hypothetical protein
VQQILWIEIIAKALIGVTLMIAPLTAASILGVQRPDTGFWPRLLGGLTLGVAAGVWVGTEFPNVHGSLGPGGLIPINLFAAGALIAQLILGSAAPTKRGKLCIAVSVLLLLALAFLEIAHV